TGELLARGTRSMPNGVPMAWMATDYELPVYVRSGRGARFVDADGHEYVDTNIADIAAFCGHSPPPVVEAVRKQVQLGTQFLLPTEDAIVVAEELARRYELPKWQFTLAASTANVEAIRVARAATRRDRVLLFDGHYHGHFDEATVTLDSGRPEPFGRGMPAATTSKVQIVAFNDADAVRAALARGDIACVLTEPALTNNLGLQLPASGFHAELREACSATGTVLIVDETHTHVVGVRGCTGLWGLRPDIVTIGKAIAGGLPMGAYGLTDGLASHLDVSRGMPVATGGTLFGNPLSMAAARAALTEVLTPDAYSNATAQGKRLADGLEEAVRGAGLPWTVHRFGPRSGVTFAPAMPRNATEARASWDRELILLSRVWLANRGVWEALPGAGPTMCVAAEPQDVDRYVQAYGDLLSAVTG
ncbi:MAG TPA: aminotransferase class III-fold pyridoxal phosphate-dependent enzyme, partial [Actinomycetota bacterium]|nr:aminotransferase class III-fold pyridoxal phosphate-dependent enzyme [Actinomycetota bacterium]